MTEEWYLDDVNGTDLGPLTTEQVVEGLRASTIPLYTSGRSSKSGPSLPLVSYFEFQSVIGEESLRQKGR